MLLARSHQRLRELFQPTRYQVEIGDGFFSFKQAIAGCDDKDSPTGKELRYNLGRAYEQDGEQDKALEIYHKLAQLDFGYRDIRERIANLRKEKSN